MLRAHNEDSAIFDEASYWAPLQARKTEVDFLLRRGREYLAIEVKSQPRFSRDMLTGLHAIADLRHVVRRVLLYLGDQKMRTPDGIDVWPLKTFLDAVARGTLWP